MTTGEPLSAQQLEDAERTLLQKIAAVGPVVGNPVSSRLGCSAAPRPRPSSCSSRSPPITPPDPVRRSTRGGPPRSTTWTFPASLPGRVGLRRGTAEQPSPERAVHGIARDAPPHTRRCGADARAHTAARRTTRRRIDRQPHDQDERPDAQPGRLEVTPMHTVIRDGLSPATVAGLLSSREPKRARRRARRSQTPAAAHVFERLLVNRPTYTSPINLRPVRRSCRPSPADLLALNPRLVFAKGHRQVAPVRMPKQRLKLGVVLVGAVGWAALPHRPRREKLVDQHGAG